MLTKQSLAQATEYLAKRDKHLALVLRDHGRPPMWARKPGFSTLVRIILEQQVSLASAASMFQRLSRNTSPFTAQRFIELGEPHLRSLGLTRQKTAYLLDLARAIAARQLKLASLSRMNDEDVRTGLMRIKGVGTWTADVYLLMALRRPDIWPASDLALATSVTKLKRLKSRPGSDELAQIAENWRPFRSVAARMLWQFYLAERRIST